jgi:DNA-binding response OmpR family regulator
LTPYSPAFARAIGARITVVLVIDRDAGIRLAARRVLEGAGFDVSTAADDGAIAAAQPDLIIADPASASLTRLRRRHSAARVLALSAEPSPRRGTTAILTKPFTPSQLLAAVRLCLARPAI